MNSSNGMDVDALFSNRWQDFEEHILKIVNTFSSDVEFRKVFFNDKRKFEIDVVAHFADFSICIDCKLYGTTRYRKSALKDQAKKHVLRCLEFEKIINRRCVPLIITLLDDDVYLDYDCLIIPYHKFNGFLCDIEAFLVF